MEQNHYYLIDQVYRFYDLGDDLSKIKQKLFETLKSRPIYCRNIIYNDVEFFTYDECQILMINYMGDLI